jgi:hypothetical protein
MPIHRIHRLLLIPALFMLAACSTVVDYTIGRPDVCKLHGVQMTKTNVPIIYGLILPLPPTDYSRALYAARTNNFPNADEVVGAGCSVDTPTTAIIYICPKCEEARQAPPTPWGGR